MNFQRTDKKLGFTFLIWMYIAFVLSVMLVASMGYLSAGMKIAKDYWPWYDKIAHFVLVGGFAFAIHSLLPYSPYQYTSKWLNRTLILILLSVLEECSQYYIPWRSFNFIDMGANVLGIVCFSYLAFLIKRKLLKNTDHETIQE
jgi:glycopeptide antibiotics resistance protein